jgi:hypothetical protein
MKRLYLMPAASLREQGPNGEFIRWKQIQIGLDHSTVPPTPVMTDIPGLFGRGEHHAIHLPGDFLLMVTGFDNERHEDWFHNHPDVAILPNPTLDGNIPLTQHIGRPLYKFVQHHLDAITAHPEIGAVPGDTVLTLWKKASAINGNFKLRNVL